MGKKLKSFSLKSATRLRFNRVLELLARELMQQEEIKGNSGREEVKLSLFADHVILHLKASKCHQKSPPRSDKYIH
jgi:hypothetical protein